jgi:hypothetical protein
MFRQEDVTDDVLVERVRSKIGRCVSHPRAIEVSAHDGRVVLSGKVLQRESPRLLSAVWGVRGVRGIENQLQAEVGNTPEWSGNDRPGELPDLMQANWSPATRLFMGGLGTTLMLNCLVKRGTSSTVMDSLGFGLVLTSMCGCSVGSRENRQEPSQDRPPHEESYV